MIYDCFTFGNELDLLEVRIHELERAVDRFVLVEATHTFSGQPKRLTFAENKRRFSAWLSRIEHVVVDDMPQSRDPWALEHHQRAAIGRGLRGCGPADVILVSDADEIPRAERVLQHRATGGVMVFQQKLAYYFLNNVSDTPWFGTRMLPFRLFQEGGGAQAVRTSEGAIVPDGGWHFSFMGGVGRIREKLQAYAHQEYNTAQITDPHYIGQAVLMRADLFNRAIQYGIEDVGELPEYVRRKRERFSDWIWEGPLFHEPWYSDRQCELLAEIYRRTHHLTGDVVEIGCWEGRSTVALANACFPARLLAVDNWEGNVEEDREHVTIQVLRQRDVFREFRRNVGLLTCGNVQPVVAHSRRFFERHSSPIRFCHIDGSHDYASVRSDIEGALTWVERGGIICGDDFAPDAPGVVRAVQELLPEHEHHGRMWVWQRR